jgi:hypothetical protein
MRRAATTVVASLAAGGLAVIAASASALGVASLLSLVMFGLLADARRWVRLAGRSRLGARSEDDVRRALAPLQAEGWRLHHSLPYRGRGDIDSVAIAPTGIAFVVETKTRTFEARHLASVREMAAWLCRRRRRWCRRGALPVLCVVRARGLERVEAGVLIVSVDRLLGSLRVAAGSSLRPTFLGRRCGGGDVIATACEQPRTRLQCPGDSAGWRSRGLAGPPVHRSGGKRLIVGRVDARQHHRAVESRIEGPVDGVRVRRRPACASARHRARGRHPVNEDRRLIRAMPRRDPWPRA